MNWKNDIKILFVAVFKPNSTNVSQSRGLKQNGFSVYEYDYRESLRQFGGNVKERDDDLITLVSFLKPDVVIFSKCNNMHYRVVDECNKYSSTVLWYMDAMHNFDQELIEKIKRVNLFVSGVEGIIYYGKKYNKRTIFVPQCPDEKLNFLRRDIDYEYDVTFIGNVSSNGVHANRAQYKKELNFTHFTNAYGVDHNKIVNQSKINLNFSPVGGDGTSVRVFKILAAGGFLLTTPWKNMENTFEIGEHLDTFCSPDDLKEKIFYYLENYQERNNIRIAGYDLVQNNFMPVHWARRIVREVLE